MFIRSFGCLKRTVDAFAAAAENDHKDRQVKLYKDDRCVFLALEKEGRENRSVDAMDDEDDDDEKKKAA